MPPDEQWFVAADTRPVSLVVALCTVLAIETVAVHLWLWSTHPFWAVALAASSLLTIIWLVADHRARRHAGVAIDSDTWRVRIGRQYRADVPREAIARVTLPDWKEVPLPASDYLNAAAPGDPNLLLEFRQPLTLRGPLGIKRQIRRMGLRLRHPSAAVACWAEP